MICLRERLHVLTGGIRVVGNEKVVMMYGIVLYGEALEGSFLFLDSMCTELSPCFPYSKGGGLKKPSEIIYIHIKKAKRNHSSSWLSPGLSLYFTVTSQHVHKTITLGVDNYIGSELCTLA